MPSWHVEKKEINFYFKVIWKKYISENVQKQVEVSRLKYDDSDTLYALMETHEFIWMNVTRLAYWLGLC